MVEEYFGWQNSFFLPEDPCEIVFFHPRYAVGDLLEVEFIMEFEKRFGIQWDTIFTNEFPAKMSFGEFVEKIASNAKDDINSKGIADGNDRKAIF